MSFYYGHCEAKHFGPSCIYCKKCWEDTVIINVLLYNFPKHTIFSQNLLWLEVRPVALLKNSTIHIFRLPADFY